MTLSKSSDLFCVFDNLSKINLLPLANTSSVMNITANINNMIKMDSDF